MYNSGNYDNLPRGWDMQFDTKTGRYYFIDHNEQKTTWKDPRIETSNNHQGGVTIPVHVEPSKKSTNIPIVVNNNQATHESHFTADRGRSSQHKSHAAENPNANLNLPGSVGDPARSRSPSPYAITSMDQIHKIMHDVDNNIKPDVEQFQGTFKDKRYLLLEDQLEKRILRLDSVESDGDQNVRLERKKAIRIIQDLLTMLEKNAKPKTDQDTAGTPATEQE